MKFFLDSANPEEIRALFALGWIEGVTTNPGLLAAAARNIDALAVEICGLIPGSLSLPVRSSDASAIVDEARHLASLDDRIIVKVPVHRAGLQAMAKLRTHGIRTHATLCCSVHQALLAAKCGAYYVSPFLGHIEQQGQSAVEVVAKIVDIYDNYDFDTQIMVASIRSPLQIQECAVLGVDACTVKPALLEELVKHPVTDELQRKDAATWMQR